LPSRTHKKKTNSSAAIASTASQVRQPRRTLSHHSALRRHKTSPLSTARASRMTAIPVRDQLATPSVPPTQATHATISQAAVLASG